MPSNAEHLRAWLMGCGAIDASKRFGVDHLGDAPTEYALMSVPSALRYRENILGQTAPLEAQSQSFVFASREACGADAAQNMANLAFYQAVTDWIAGQSARGDLPEWEGGRVTAVAPTLTAAPVAWGPGAARYQIQIRVDYRTEEQERR